MLVARSKNHRSGLVDDAITRVLRAVSLDRLHSYVEMLEFPRHYLAESQANRRARDLLLDMLKRFGYSPSLHGSYDILRSVRIDT
jgi:hypothetical protein